MTRDPPLADSMSAGLIDRAETFEESGVSVSHSSTLLDNGSLSLGSGVGSTVSLTGTNTWSPTAADGDEWGCVIQTAESVPEISVTAAADNDLSDVDIVLEDKTDGEELDRITGQSITGGETWTFNAALEAGKTYWLLAVPQSNFEMTAVDTGTGTSTDFDVTGGRYNGLSNSSGYIWDTIDAAEPADSGTATVDWSHPPDIYRWDSVLFQRTPDGETVTVDVQESADGGSTWTTIATDVSRGQEITADPANEVRLKVNLSRSDTAKNPTLDAAYRRYVI